MAGTADAAAPAAGGGGGRRAAAAGRREGLLRTYQPAMAREIVEEARRRSPERRRGDEPESPATAALNAWQARKAAQRAAIEAKVHARAEAFREVSRRRAAEAAARRDEEFESTLQEVMAGIVGGGGITAETQAVLEDARRAYSERQAALYGEWREQVFEKIQARIREGVSRRSIRELESQLREAASAYVAAVNSKPLGVYLDVVMPDYDPLAPLARTVKITTTDVFDPLKKDLLKTQAEKELLRVPPGGFGGARGGSSPGRRSQQLRAEGPGGGGSRSSGGGGGGGGGPGSRGASPARPEPATQLAAATTRLMLDTKKWGALQIRATPACHCISDEGLYCVRPPAPAALAMGASRVVMDDFSPAAAGRQPYRPSKRMGGGGAHTDHVTEIVQWRGGRAEREDPPARSS
ncbi:hypothetical protein Rsub_03294 [Raphidocelis subcapitata]|uniref:Uncharacterized protein n=1 Tax=Raphidocelis subcapitata TaxID=307507 RepID=A0A2V0NR96_9CHLO|nr:hypothetical protein Rsub_03294 [Raphidocelis subcapitata]|eukprot:GBF90161.1 hypothetical protein Rsub_03294 [Raphidocelis subcapitata]